jgi:hypothetical protein
MGESGRPVTPARPPGSPASERGPEAGIVEQRVPPSLMAETAVRRKSSTDAKAKALSVTSEPSTLYALRPRQTARPEARSVSTAPKSAVASRRAYWLASSWWMVTASR